MKGGFCPRAGRDRPAQTERTADRARSAEDLGSDRERFNWKRQFLRRTLMDAARAPLSALRGGARARSQSPDSAGDSHTKDRYLNRRTSPRLPLHLPVEAILSDGRRLSARGLDISRHGLGISFDTRGGQYALPTRDTAAGGCVTIRFQLPIPDAAPVPVKALARIVWQRVVDGQPRAGLQFLGFEGNGYQILESYLVDHLP